MQQDIVALEDHPDDPEEWKSVSLNFGKCIIILVQRLSKLNQASKILKRKGYYDSWDKDHYDDVVEEIEEYMKCPFSLNRRENESTAN